MDLFAVQQAEAWDQNVHAPKILDAAGIPVAFKSDHPVTNAVSWKPYMTIER